MILPALCATLTMLPPVGSDHSAIITRPDQADSIHLRLANTDALAPVVLVLGPDGGVAGTGTLLDARWVLTAGHVVRTARPDSLRIVRLGDTIAVSAGVVHPQGAESVPGFERQDAGLLRLARPIGAPVVPFRLDVDPAVGDTVLIVGYGVGGPQAGPAGTRRAAHNRIDQIGGTADRKAPHFVLFMDLDVPGRPDLNATGSPEPLPLEGIQSGGDSGGPVLRQTPSGFALVGVYYRTSYQVGGMLEQPRQFGGSVSQSVSITSLRQWILEETTR